MVRRFGVFVSAVVVASCVAPAHPPASTGPLTFGDAGVPTDGAGATDAAAADGTADAVPADGLDDDAAPGTDAVADTGEVPPDGAQDAPPADVAGPDVPDVADTVPDAVVDTAEDAVNPAQEASGSGCKAWFGQGCGGCACEAAVCAEMPQCCKQLWGQACSALCADKGGACAVADAGPGDATPADTADTADAGAFACAPQLEGQVPGATIDLGKTPCSFSIAKANGVFPLPYAIQVDSATPIWNTDPNVGQCPPQNVFGGLAVFVTVEGIGDGVPQKWCLCDVGLCPPPKDTVFTPTQPGSYQHAFVWDGKNWDGPSDTGNPPGAPFPPGLYTFTVTAQGLYQTPGGGEDFFQAKAKLQIQLLP